MTVKPQPWRDLAVRADRGLARFEMAFIGAALAFSTLLLFVNVVLRYVFLAPIGWAEELTIYLIVWVVLIGGSIAVRARGHIAVDLLPYVLSPANRRRLQILILVVMMVFFAAFFYYGGQHTLRVRSLGQVTPMMQAPMWLAYLALPVGSFLMFLRSGQLLVTAIRETPSEDDEHVPDMRD